MTLDADHFSAACHCGAVRFDVQLSNGLHSARRCTCSFCRMRGAVAVSADLSGITFVQGEDALTMYRFNTGTARHYFCSKCGIHTHHQRRSNPEEFGINVACLEGLSPFDFLQVPVFDGVRHPSDHPERSAPLLAGILSYDPSEDEKDDRRPGPILLSTIGRSSGKATGQSV